MAGAPAYFLGFGFDEGTAQLRQGDVPVPLRPKSADVLRCLVARAGEVVSKQEILEAVWPEGFVGDNTLAVCIHELREVLGDDPHQPRYIATEHRQGYRFVAPVSTAPPATETPARALVGRERELATLGEWWQQAVARQRQVGFLSAQAGVGKTALVEDFAAGLDGSGAYVAWGQGVELYGEGEPYLPVLEALTALCRGPDGQHVAEVLRTEAPTWALRLPGVVPADDAESRRWQGASADRMLRELTQALETITVRTPLLLVLEDLHDADPATIDLLAYLPRRRQPAALLVLVTYRPVEAVLRAHPLRAVVQDLRSRELCRYLALELLSERAVADHLSRRLAPARPSAELVSEVCLRTDGNALFLVAVVDYLIERGLLVVESGVASSRRPLVELAVPDSLRQLIDHQVERLAPADRSIVGMASVAGVEFTSSAVAAGLGEPPDSPEVEDRTRQLAAVTGLFAPDGVTEWPDGTLGTRYRFAHALYQEVVYDHHLGPVARRAAHLRIGERTAAAYGERAGDVAAELAVHFERGGDRDRAVHYLALAAQHALELSAHATALEHTGRALDLLRHSAADARLEAELRVRLIEVSAMVVAGHFNTPRIERVYARVDELAEAVGDQRARAASLYGQWNAAMTLGHLALAGRLAADMSALAERSSDVSHRLQSHNMNAQTALTIGDPRTAVQETEAAAALDPVAHRAPEYGEDPELLRLLHGAAAIWLLGRADAARDSVHRGLTLARDVGHPAGVAHALWHAGVIHQLSGDTDDVRELCGELVRLCHAYDVRIWAPLGTILGGWATPDDPAAADRMRGALAAWASLGFALTVPYHTGLLAHTLAGLGRAGEALDAVEDALAVADRTGDRWYEAELTRSRAQLRLLTGRIDHGGLETELTRALEIARRQGARALELRCAVDLARCWHGQGESGRARRLLEAACDDLGGRHTTSDLAQARALVAALG